MCALADGDRARDADARRVNGLEAVGLVNAARDLLDQHGRKALRAELLVYAQKVDFHQVLGPKKR